ncbi:hypothetical protein L596_010109 [Steinernema carpocapsae]|uniref:7TM GPCR serpentine receptor class x (Srx) domain-containing protein n=1 Tax=Steinernema carpocapsae TaxID=34508 RepID=A0A4U5PHJ5_STECR|nr:hypothetical protein L596_010109 [Steinernema carpocapsae]
MIVNGPLTIFGRAIGKTCFMVFASGFILNIELLALTFVYRWVYICKKHRLYKFSQPHVIAQIVFCLVAPIAGLDLAMTFAYTFSFDFSIHTGEETYGIRVLYVEDIVS